MDKEKIKGLIRHLLTLAGGILVTLGVFTADSVEILTTALIEIVGGVLTAWGVIASYKNKDKIADGNSEAS